MKKTILIISLSIFILTSLRAQEKIQFGAKGGINFTNMTKAEYFFDNKSKTGFHIGLIAEIPFGDKFSIQPEIVYSTQGTKAKLIFPGSPGPMDVEYSLDYIQVPVLAKIYLIKNLSFEIGPSFNFLVHDEEKYESRSYSDIGNNFEFSGILGISYKQKSGLFGSLRYVKGLTVALDREKYGEDVKNFGFQLGVGFMF